MALTRKPLSLKARALQALALRDHSRRELEQKLLRGARRPPAPRHGHAGRDGDEALADPAAAPSAAEGGEPTSLEAQVSALLDELEARGLLCQERFVESRVHAREARFGNRRIEAELAQHGLQLAPEAAAELRRTELDRARAVWARRYSPAPPGQAVDAAEAARQMRFLAARGFSADVIRRVVKGGPNEE